MLIAGVDVKIVVIHQTPQLSALIHFVPQVESALTLDGSTSETHCVGDLFGVWYFWVRSRSFIATEKSDLWLCYVNLVCLRYNHVDVVLFCHIFYSQVQFMGVLASELELLYFSAVIAANLSIGVDFNLSAGVK